MATADKLTQVDLEALFSGTSVSSLTQIQMDTLRFLSSGGGVIPVDPSSVAVLSRSKYYSATSDGTKEDLTYQSKHEVLTDSEGLILVYGNFYQDDRTTDLSPYTLNVSAFIGGVNYPMTFNNSASKRLELGDMVTTDNLKVSLKKGDMIWIRSHVVQALGEKHPRGLTLFSSPNNEGYTIGDTTKTTTAVTPVAGTLFGLTPLVLLSKPVASTFKTVGLCGSSSSTGTGRPNTVLEGHPQGEIGFMQIGALRAGWGYVSIGMNGQKASDFVDPVKRKSRVQLVKDCDLVIVQYASNDLATASTTFESLKAELLTIHKVFWDMGIETAQTTVNPRTTSTDGWATTANQTPINANFAAGANSPRGKFNAWVMNNTDGIRGIDVNVGWESYPNSGVWRVDQVCTVDGIHPNAFGHDNEAANMFATFLKTEKGVAPTFIPTATRSKWYDKTSAGVDVNITYRTIHEASCDHENITLMYGNFYQDGRTTNLAPYTIKVSIDVAGINYPVTFDKATSRTVNLGERVLTDVVNVSLKKGDRFFVRAHVLQNAGERHPCGITTMNTGEGVAEGDLSAGVYTARNPNPAYVLGPLALYGTPSPSAGVFKTVGLCGDSISVGAGHTNVAIDGHPIGEVGLLQIGAMKAGWGYVSIGMNGQKASDFADPAKRINQVAMVRGCSLVIVEYGTNDLTTANKTLAALKADILTIHKAYWDIGIPTVQTTIAPRTTSTDAWATTANQTPINELTAGGEDSVRSQCNNWIRNNTDGIRCIEIADLWDSGRNTGLWKDTPVHTVDGIHPNTYGHGTGAIPIRDFLLTQ